MSQMTPLDPELLFGPLVHRFREALARRRIGGLDLFRASSTTAFHCAPCFEAAAEARGFSREPLPFLPEDASVLESYDLLRWFVTQPGQVPDEDEDDEDDDERVPESRELDDEPRVTMRPPCRYGLFRLVPRCGADDGTIYYWVFEREYDDHLLVAARRRDDFERLVGDLERRHAAHERTRPGLIVLGDTGEHRVRAQRIAWEDLLLPATIREDLERTIREFFASRALYRKHGLAYRRGLLLAGPPGNGKTTILRAIGATAGVPVIVVAGLANEGKRGALIQNAFARAGVLAPAVLCFEDLDGLIDDGPSLSLFLNLLDGLEPLDGVLVVATTNRPDRIDPAIAKRPSRFDRVFSIPTPDRDLRRAYLGRVLERTPEASLDRLASRTEGLSVAFLKEIVIQARFTAVRRGDDTVSDDDLADALESIQDHVRLATRGLEDRGELGFSRAG